MYQLLPCILDISASIFQLKVYSHEYIKIEHKNEGINDGNI